MRPRQILLQEINLQKFISSRSSSTYPQWAATHRSLGSRSWKNGVCLTLPSGCQKKLTSVVVNVDVDTMDPAFPGTLPIKPHNQTSNQLIVSEHMLRPENREMFLQAVRDYKDQGWQAVHTRVVG